MLRTIGMSKLPISDFPHLLILMASTYSKDAVLQDMSLQKFLLMLSMILRLMYLALESFYLFCKLFSFSISQIFSSLTGGSPFYGRSYNEILWKNKVCEVKFDFKGTNIKVSDPGNITLLYILIRFSYRSFKENDGKGS